MLLKFSTSSFKYNGRVHGEIWTTSGLRGIARNRVRPNPKSHGLVYQPLFTLAAAKAEWEGLSEAIQSDWATLAAATFGWPIQGSPRYLTGEEFFTNYLTVLRTITPAAAVPSVPAAGPTWQDRPKFFEIAEWIGGIYTLKAETSFDSGTVLLFSGLPPTATIFKPDFSKEVFIGSHTFTGGLDPDEEWDGIDAMMSAAFGAISSDLKVWGRVWEVQDGYIRTIKDPCGPNPTSTIDPTFPEYIFYNNYSEELDFSYFYFGHDAEEAAYWELSGTAPYESAEGNVPFNPGYNTSMVNNGQFHASWIDGAWGYWELFPPYSWNPLEFTLWPNYE